MSPPETSAALKGRRARRKDRTPNPETAAPLFSRAPLLSETQAAARMGLSKAWFSNRRCLGQSPPFIVITGRTIRYRVEDLEAFERETCRVANPRLRALGREGGLTVPEAIDKAVDKAGGGNAG
jgi:hypothetical protein